MENCTQHFCQKTTFLLHPSNKISTSQRQNSLNVQRSMARRQLTVTERCRNVSGGGKRKRRRGEGARKWVSCQIWKRRANQRRKGVSQVIERWWDSRRDRHTANGRRWSRKVSDAKSCRSSLARPRIYSANIVPWRDEKWENMGIKCAWKVGPLRLFLALQPKDSRLGMFSPAWVEVYRWCICALCDITKGQFPINWRFLEGTRWKVDWAKQAQGELFFFFFHLQIHKFTDFCTKSKFCLFCAHYVWGMRVGRRLLFSPAVAAGMQWGVSHCATPSSPSLVFSGVGLQESTHPLTQNHPSPSRSLHGSWWCTTASERCT